MKKMQRFNLLWVLIVAIWAIGGASAETGGAAEHPDFNRIDRYIESQMADKAFLLFRHVGSNQMGV